MTKGTLDKLAIELFKTFSRFEYALKASGFNNGDGEAQANWRNFALSIELELQNPQTPELREAIDFMLKHSPKKQVIRNGLLAWDAAPPNTNSTADLILLYVRRVRNNLFHGGKFNGHWFAPERSEKLLRHSLVILNACLDGSPQVRSAFKS
jgi:hypothetical protein